MVRLRSNKEGLCYVEGQRINPGNNNKMSEEVFERLLKNKWFARQLKNGAFAVDRFDVSASDIDEMTVVEARYVIDIIDDVDVLKTYLKDKRKTIRRMTERRIAKLRADRAEEDSKESGEDAS